MLSKLKIVNVIILSLPIVACEKKQINAPSQVNVDTRESMERELEAAFQGKVTKLKWAIKAAELTLGRVYSPYSYWGIPIKTHEQGEILETFYFKKNETNVGPDIYVEFTDSSQSVNYFLTSYNSARSSFSADSSRDSGRALDPLDLLKKESQRNPSSEFLKSISDNLNDLAKFLEKPSIVKKFEGQDPTGKRCYVHTTNDLNGDILKVEVGFKNEKDRYYNLKFFLGPIKFETQTCRDIVFDATKQKGFSTHKYPYGYGITYASHSIKTTPGEETFEASQTQKGLYGWLVLSGLSCEKTQLTLCHDRAQIQRINFGAGMVTLLPFLGGGIKENISIDCNNLRNL
jgi:hypothetical protein